jgi:chemotaxis protein methyltransferase CheR
MSIMAQASPDLGIAAQDHLRIVPPHQASTMGTDERIALAHALTATVHEPLIVLDGELRIVAASLSYREMFPANFANSNNRAVAELNCLQWDNSVLELLASVLSQAAAIEDHEIELNLPEIGQRRFLLNARLAGDRGDSGALMIVGLEDVSARREADELKSALREKQEMLLVEVHHRVANSLQIIASILLLKARAVKSEEIRRHLHDVHHRIVSVATVQRQLSVAGPGQYVELGPYLTLLCEGLASSMIGDDQEVQITSFATAGTIKSEDAVSFGLIVTELVINALKHGFPNGRKGHIVVDYVNESGEWRLSVSDDGVGRSPNSPGPAHVGLGTSIVEALAKNLGARVEIAPPGPGAATTIAHPARGDAAVRGAGRGGEPIAKAASR